MNQLRYFLFLVLISLSTSISTFGQDAAMEAGNAQRSRVLPTEGLAAAPAATLWSSKKLFVYRQLLSEQRMDIGSSLSLFWDADDQYFSLPIVARGVVYAMYNSSNDGYFFALDAQTGQQFPTLKFPKNHISAPAALDDLVYFGAAHGVYAYDVRKQQKIWVFNPQDHSFSFSTLAIQDRTLYVADRGLFAVDADTGNLLWSFDNKQWLTAVAVAQGRVVFQTAEGAMIALSAKDGARIWEVQIGEVSTPAILDDQIFLRIKREVRAYRLSDGAQVWKAGNRGGAGSSLALYQGLVIYGGREDTVVALDSRTGELRWEFKTQRPCRYPTIAGKTLFIPCQDRKLYAIDPLTGKEQWRFDNKKSAPPPPTFANGVMYMLGGDGILSALR